MNDVEMLFLYILNLRSILPESFFFFLKKCLRGPGDKAENGLNYIFAIDVLTLFAPKGQ